MIETTQSQAPFWWRGVLPWRDRKWAPWRKQMAFSSRLVTWGGKLHKKKRLDFWVANFVSGVDWILFKKWHSGSNLHTEKPVSDVKSDTPMTQAPASTGTALSTALVVNMQCVVQITIARSKLGAQVWGHLSCVSQPDGCAALTIRIFAGMEYVWRLFGYITSKHVQDLWGSTLCIESSCSKFCLQEDGVNSIGHLDCVLFFCNAFMVWLSVEKHTDLHSA